MMNTNITFEESVKNNLDIVARLQTWIRYSKEDPKVLEDAIIRAIKSIKRRIIERREV